MKIRDTFFSLHRFANVCRKEIIENWKSLLLRMLLMYGGLAVVLVWNAYYEYGRWLDVLRMQDRIEQGIWTFGTVIFMIGMGVMGCLGASFMMEGMKTKNGRLGVLMTPATMFEKFFARWLVFTFGFLLVYLVAYRLADWTRMLVYMAAYPEAATVAQVPLLSHLVGGCRDCAGHWTAFPTYRQFLLAFSIYFFFQSCFVLGSTVWSKNAFVKTFVAGVGIVIVYVSVAVMMCKWLLENHYMQDMGEPTENQLLLLATLVSSFMALFNWTVAYFRFKESEIINRW